MTINEIITEAHNNAIAHGWHDGVHNPVELLCLIHSEVSEVLEEIRNSEYIVVNQMKLVSNETMTQNRTINGKPEGVPSELADIVIRVADMCGLYGIDLEAAIIEKMEYNKHRPYRHGGKAL